MVERDSAALDRIFHALADPTRRAILRRVAERECSVTELAEPFDMSLAAVGKHVRVLEQAALVRRARRGKFHQCRLNVVPLRHAANHIASIEQFWNANLDSLVDFMRQQSAGEPIEAGETGTGGAGSAEPEPGTRRTGESGDAADAGAAR
jgi:DNA-binding transcriptional ArsR family regulator